MDTSFLYHNGKKGWVSKIWEPSTHGNRHITTLLNKTDVDAG